MRRITANLNERSYLMTGDRGLANFDFGEWCKAEEKIHEICQKRLYAHCYAQALQPQEKLHCPAPLNSTLGLQIVRSPNSRNELCSICVELFCRNLVLCSPPFRERVNF